MENNKIKLSDFIGTDNEENFMDFDLTEIQQVLSQLKEIDIIDLAHCELLQLQALRAADIITEYLARVVKTTNYLEARCNKVKNEASLKYSGENGRATADQRKYAGESSPELEDYMIKLAKAKASKIFLENKLNILVRQHHYYKDIAGGMRKTVLGYSAGGSSNNERIPRDEVAEGWR